MKNIWFHLDVHSLDNFTCVSVQKAMFILAVNSHNWGLEDFWPSECPFDSRRQHYLYWAIVPLNKNGARWFLLMALHMVCVWFIYWEWPRTDKVLVHLTCSGISNVFEFQISDIPLDNRNARNRNDLAAWRPPLCVVRKPFRWRSCWYTERCSLQLMYNVYIYICIHTIFRKIW